jgi:hypothetical protein
MMGKLVLQVLTALVGLLTLVLSGMSLALGTRSPIYSDVAMPVSPILDSNLRFFGGLGIGLGGMLLLSVVGIEERTTLFRASWVLAFIGGVGRLVSLFSVGSPSSLLLGFTILEVIGAPIFIAWQSRLS